MIATVSKSRTLSCAHYLPHHRGKCRQFHGHDFTIRVSVTGPVQEPTDANPASGMVIDISRLADFLDGLAFDWDHQLLNEVADPCPTVERLALLVAERAKKLLTPSLPAYCRVSKVTVAEGPGVTAEVELR